MLAALFKTQKMKPWEIPPHPGESAADHKERRRQAYFQEQRDNNIEWFKRMDFQMDVRGLRVLDLGCGHGALSIGLAEKGAAKVIGLDLDPDRIDFANRKLTTDFATLQGKIEFRCENVFDLRDQFDLIVSKDAFEHIEDLARVVQHLHGLLKPGGHLAPGFSPLYFSPFGDHARFAMKVPWAHALVPEAMALRWLKSRTGKDVTSSMDLGLNRLTPTEFRAIFADTTAWDHVHIQYNRGDNRLFPVFNALRQIQSLERFFTTSIYAVARKARNASRNT